jgi:CcmD family protein
MTMMRMRLVLCVALLLAPLTAAAQPDPALPPAPPPPLHEGLPEPPFPALQARMQPTVPPAEPDDEFVPVSELPPEERLPAAPMLVAAYAFVVLALFAYVLSLSRRLSAVGREILRLEEQVKRGQRP